MYFTNVSTQEELRMVYKKQAKALHPDLNGGSDEEFKKMLNEYEELMKKGFSNPNTTEFDLSSMSQEFIVAYNVISELGIEYEVVGKWIWIGEGAYQVKDKLKKIGCRWASKKKKWYWGTMESKKRSKGMKYEDIKNKYGVNKANIKVKIK